MPVEGDFEMSCWSFLEIIWFHFWEAVHMEKWCSQTKDMLDWFFLMSLLLRSRKNWRIREGKCQIYLVYNKETLLFDCCSSYTSSQTSPSTMRKCLKKLCLKMFWFVYINLNNNDFLLFPILPKRTEEAAQSERLEEI